MKYFEKVFKEVKRMENKELIISVIQAYERAQEISANIPGQARENLGRKNKHTISSYLEDITGAFIADLLAGHYQVWIDQTFYFGNSRSQFRPDITIVKRDNGENIIIGFFEVKDSPNPFRWDSTGAQNRGIEYVNQRILKLNTYRGGRLKYKVIGRRNRVEIMVSPSAKFDLILFSDRLFKANKLTALRAACNGDYIYLHILLSGFHPNVKHQNHTAEQLINWIENNTLRNGTYSETSLRNRLQEIQNI